MPALLWVAFWSSMMATATCWDEVAKPVPAKTPAKKLVINAPDRDERDGTH